MSKVKTWGKGELKHELGVYVLKVKGSYYEMGYQYGFLLKDEIKEIYQKINVLKDAVILKIPPFLQRIFNLLLKIKLKFLAIRLPENYKKELKGIADGADIDYNDVLSMGLFLELVMSSLPAISEMLAEADCSTVIVKTEDKIYHGRNFDFIPLFLGEYPLIIQYHPDGKKRYTSIGIIGYPGVFTGCNEDGLTISLNISVGYKRRFKEVPITYKVRQILESCTYFKEVEKAFEKYKVEAGMIIGVSSKEENTGVIYDLGISRKAKNKMTDNNYLYACNRYLNCKVSKIETPVLFGNSYINLAREEKISELLNRGVRSVEDFINLLSNTDYYMYKELLGTHNGTINNERTLHSLVFDVKSNVLYFAFSPGLAGWTDYFEFNPSNGDIKLHKKTEKILDEKIRKYLNWCDGVLLDITTNNYQKIVDSILDFEELNRAQLIILQKIWNEAKELIDLEKLFDLIDKTLDKYQEFGFLYKCKGKFLFSLDRFDDAIKVLEEGLLARVLFPAEMIEIYQFLAMAYDQIGNKSKAVYYANGCLELIFQFNKKYKIGKLERKIIRKMEKIVF